MAMRRHLPLCGCDGARNPGVIALRSEPGQTLGGLAVLLLQRQQLLLCFLLQRLRLHLQRGTRFISGHGLQLGLQALQLGNFQRTQRIQRL